MKSIKTFFLFFILTKSLYGQYGIVQDKEGFANVREGKSIISKIIDTIQTGKALYFYEPEGDWYDVSYLKNKKNITGFIHKSRVTFISSFKLIKPATKTKGKIEFSLDSIKLTVTTEPFIPKNNKLTYTKPSKETNDRSYIEKINGLEYYGSDGMMPTSQYKKISLQIGSKTILLPTAKLYEPFFDFMQFYFDKNTNSFFLTTSNGDGAGAYVVLWVIKERKFIQREIDIPF